MDETKNMDETKKMDEPKKIFNHPDWEIYRPKRITWVGFLVAWVFVIALMIITWFIARIGA